MRQRPAVLRGEGMVGMEKCLSLYRKRTGWQGEYLQGVSVTYGQKRNLTAARDKTRNHRVEQGVQLEKWADVKIPLESMNKHTNVEVGDILLPGRGPKELAQPSQPKKEGWPYFVVQQVEDRREDAVLPHLRLKCL